MRCIHKGITTSRLILACLVALLSGPAFADNLGKPMTFQFYPRGMPPHIQADGAITEDTPRTFLQFLSEHGVTETMPAPERPKVYLTSEGGKLLAGLELGRLVRRFHLETNLAATEPVSQRSREILSRFGIVVPRMAGEDLPLESAIGDHPTYCVSACTLAFLGGIHRWTYFDSVYAVHQFGVDCENSAEPTVQEICTNGRQAMALAQQQSAEISRYLEEMAIPTEFLSQMVLADPKHVNVLSKSDMEKYRILTPVFLREETWEMDWSESGREFVLVYHQHEPGNFGDTKITFACNHAAGMTITLITDHHDQEELEVGHFAISYQNAAGYDNLHWFALGGDEILRYPSLTAGDRVQFVIRGTPRVIAALRSATFHSQIIGTRQAEALGPAAFGEAVGKGFGLQTVYVNFHVDTEKLDSYVASCH